MLNDWTKKWFGWTPEEKYRQINPGKRYAPMVRDIMNSPELAA